MKYLITAQPVKSRYILCDTKEEAEELFWHTSHNFPDIVEVSDDISPEKAEKITLNLMFPTGNNE